MIAEKFTDIARALHHFEGEVVVVKQPNDEHRGKLIRVGTEYNVSAAWFHVWDISFIDTEKGLIKIMGGSDDSS